MNRVLMILSCCFLCGLSSLVNAGIILGNTQGHIILTEFYDYQCPHCHHMSPVIDSLIQKNKDLKVDLDPVGVLDNTSVIEAGLAMVSAMQTPYFLQYHGFLMQHSALSLNDLTKLAKQLQLTTPKAKQALMSHPVQQALEENLNTLQQLLASHGGSPNLVQIPVITLQLKHKPGTMLVIAGESSITVLQDKINALRRQA